jgi:hypothetical protein
MAGNLTDVAENLVLDWLNPGQTAPTRPPGLSLRLMTANGTDSSAGTEVSGGSYAAQSLTLDAASGGATANSSTISYTGMPACTVVGVEIWDTSGTPRRLWWGALAASRTVNSGDTFEFAAGDLDLSLD